MRLPKRTRTPLRAATLLLAGALAACSDAPTGTAPAAEDATLARQVAALGFRADMIEDHGDFVLVEGDIYVSKAQLRTVPLVDGDDPLRPSFQYHTTNLVSSANVHDITVDVSGVASQPGWQTAAREALTHWSGIANSYVRMVEGGPADITVATTCTSSNVAAFASFPSGGNVGPTVYVNTCFGYSTTHAQKVHNMVHEFGHTLGFRHSNYVQNGESAGIEGAVHIYGTPTSGNASSSVMNGGTALNSWAGFATSDLTAVRSIYHLPLPQLTITDLNGSPLVSWSSLVDATSYSVSLITYEYIVDQYGQEWYQGRYFRHVDSTSGTSVLDTMRSYTGEYRCSGMDFQGNETARYYEYEVVVTFPNGTSSTRQYARVADDSFCW